MAAKPSNVPARSAGPRRLSIERSEHAVQIAWNVDTVPPPTEGFVADYVDAASREDSFALIFGKARPYTHDCQTLVEITFARRTFESIVWKSLGGDFLERLSKVCADRYDAWSPAKIRSLDKAEYHALYANLARVSYAADEALIDFYMFSTHDVSQILTGSNLEDAEITSILRVTLTAPLLLSLLLKCKEVLG